MGFWRSPLRSPRAGALLSAAVGALVYANALGNGFAYDDVQVIRENAAIHELSRLPESLGRPYWANPSGRELGLWRPLTTALFGLQWALWGDEPALFHAVNVVGHAAVSGLAVLLLASLVPAGAAFLGGLLFAVHPVHVEAVSNVVGLAEIASAVFYLGACLLFVRWRRRVGPGRVAALGLLYALAFLTKESAVTLPGALVLLDLWLDRSRISDLPGYVKGRLGLLLTLSGVAAAILWARTGVLGSVANPYPPLGADILAEVPRIWTVAAVWPHYVRLLVFPLELSPDYSPAVVEILHGWNAANVLGVGLILALLGLAWVAWRADAGDPEGEIWSGSAALTLGILWFVITISPISNVFFLSGVLLAERTLYIPSLGFAVGAGWLLRAVGRRTPRGAVAVTAVAGALLAARTWTMTPVWRSTATVFEHLLQNHYESGRLQWVLADHLFEDRDDPDRALDVFRLAVGLNGRSYPLMIDVVERLVALERLPQAEALARWTWRDNPGLPQAPGLLAIALAEQGRYAAALEPGRAALEADHPGLGGPETEALIHHILARAYTELQRWDEAVRHRRATIESGEGYHWMQWRWLAELEARRGDTAAALSALDSARARTGDLPGPRAFLDTLEARWRRGGGGL